MNDVNLASTIGIWIVIIGIIIWSICAIREGYLKQKEKYKFKHDPKELDTGE